MSEFTVLYVGGKVQRDEMVALFDRTDAVTNRIAEYYEEHAEVTPGVHRYSCTVECIVFLLATGSFQRVGHGDGGGSGLENND